MKLNHDYLTILSKNIHLLRSLHPRQQADDTAINVVFYLNFVLKSSARLARPIDLVPKKMEFSRPI